MRPKASLECGADMHRSHFWRKLLLRKRQSKNEPTHSPEPFLDKVFVKIESGAYCPDTPKTFGQAAKVQTILKSSSQFR